MSIESLIKHEAWRKYLKKQGRVLHLARKGSIMKQRDNKSRELEQENAELKKEMAKLKLEIARLKRLLNSAICPNCGCYCV